MKTIVIKVDGIPKAQPRAKAASWKGGTRVYDPGTADGWKALVAYAAKPYLPETPYDFPLDVQIEFFLPRPKRLMRKKDPDGAVWHTGKPDRDNLDKAVLDTLTQIGMWKDDCYVCDGRILKKYHAKNGKPGAIITIGPANGYDQFAS